MSPGATAFLLYLPPQLPHPFALLLEVLQVLGELHADARHHVLGHQLSLAGVVVELVEDLLEGGVVAEPADAQNRPVTGRNTPQRSIKTTQPSLRWYVGSSARCSD